MILRNNQSELLQVGEFDSIQMGIDMSDPSKIMYLLSQGLYQRPRHSIVAEYLSNSIDSLVEKGVDPIDQPAIVGLDNKKIWFKDNGVGTSLDRMNKIISKFGASTKDKSNKFMGCMGLGCKTGFSYTSQFTWESNYEGIKRTWLFSKNGTKFEISLLDETDTEEENGTTIIIPINNDFNSWKEAILDMLPYFKGVIVDHPDFDAFNKAMLYEGKTFYYKESFAPSNFHIVLDQVIYEISLYDLGLPSLDFPFGVKFGLDEGLIPTPAKDKILLTDESKEIIRNRLKETLEEINQLIVQDRPNLYQFLTRNKYFFDINIESKTIVKLPTNEYVKLCNKLEIQEPGINLTPIDDNFTLIPQPDKSYLLAFLTSNYSEVGRIKYNGTYSKEYFSYKPNDFSKIIIVDTSLSQSKIDFFKTKNLTQNVFVKFNRTNASLKKYKDIRGLWLDKIPKAQWRAAIIAWQKEEDLVLNSFPKVSDYQKEYEEWLSKKPQKPKKSNRLGTKEDNDVTIRFPVQFDVRNSSFNMKFEPKFVNTSTLNKKLYIYSTEREEVDKLYDLWRNQKNIVPIMVNKTEISKIEKIKNCISYQEFIKGKTRFAQKWVTAWLINQDINNDKLLKKLFYKQYNNEYKKIDKIDNFKSLFSINRKGKASLIQKEINTIIDYMNKWGASSSDNTFINSVVETYTKLGLVDIPVLQQWSALKKNLQYYDTILYVKDVNENCKFIDEVLLLKKKNEMYQRQINKLKNDLNNCKSNSNL